MHHPCQAKTLGAATYNQPWMFETREFDPISIRFPMISLFLDLDQASFCGFFWQSGSHKRDQKVCLQPFNPWSLRCAESKAWFLAFMEPQKAIPQFWMTSFEKWLHQETWRNTQQSAVETGVGAGISYQAPPDPAESYELKPRPIGASVCDDSVFWILHEVRFTLFHCFIVFVDKLKVKRYGEKWEEWSIHRFSQWALL